MTQKGAYLFASVFSIALAFLYYLHFSGKSKVAFVRSNELVYGYEGMKEAHVLQESKTREYKSNLDTLQSDLQKAIGRYHLEFPQLSKQEKIEREHIISLQQENLKEYSQKIQASIKENDLSLTQGILNQINSFVEEYAKKHHYTLIFGTTSSGNVLYGDPGIDITTEVLTHLNQNYKNLPDSSAHEN